MANPNLHPKPVTVNALFGTDTYPEPIIGQSAAAVVAARELVRTGGPEAARALLAFVAAYQQTNALAAVA